MKLRALTNGDIVFCRGDFLALIPKEIIESVQARSHPDSPEHDLRLFESDRAVPIMARTLQEYADRGDRTAVDQLKYYSEKSNCNLAEGLAMANLGEAIGVTNPWSWRYGVDSGQHAGQLSQVEQGLFAGVALAPAYNYYAGTVGYIDGKPWGSAFLETTYFTMQLEKNATAKTVPSAWLLAGEELGLTDAQIAAAVSVRAAYPGVAPVFSRETADSEYYRTHFFVPNMPDLHSCFGIQTPLLPLPQNAEEYLVWFKKELEGWPAQSCPERSEDRDDRDTGRENPNPRDAERFARKLENIIDYTKALSIKFSPKEYAPYTNQAFASSLPYNPQYGFVRGEGASIHEKKRFLSLLTGLFKRDKGVNIYKYKRHIGESFQVSFFIRTTAGEKLPKIPAFEVSETGYGRNEAFHAKPIEGLRAISEHVFHELIAFAKAQREKDRQIIESIQPARSSFPERGILPAGVVRSDDVPTSAATARTTRKETPLKSL